MPIPKYDGSPEQEWIGKCMQEIGTEYEQEQALAICYKQMEMKEIQMEEDIQAIYDKLPEPTAEEGEEAYIERCIPVLYPDEFDQQQAASFCADHYGNIATMGMKKQNFKSMGTKSKNRFGINLELAQKQIAEYQLKQEGVNLAEYPWDECIADQLDRGYSEESANNICGYIKSKYGGGGE